MPHLHSRNQYSSLNSIRVVCHACLSSHTIRVEYVFASKKINIFLKRWGWLERRLRVGSLRMRMYMYAIGMLVDFTLCQMFAMRKRQSSLPYPTHSRQCYKTQFNSVYYDSLRATRAFISFLIIPSRPRTHAGLEFMGKKEEKKNRKI